MKILFVIRVILTRGNVCRIYDIVLNAKVKVVTLGDKKEKYQL